MIKISEIINTNKLIYLTDKGIDEVKKVEALLKLLTHFDIDPGHVHNDESKKWQLALNLEIWIDERMIVPGEKLVFQVLFKRIKDILGSFDREDEFKAYLEELAQEGLINY